MKVALLSDIHANRAALGRVEWLLSEADVTLFLGDAVGYNRDVNECLEWLQRSGATCILGNHDFWMLNGCPSRLGDVVREGVEYADRVITPENRAWLESVPLTKDFRLGGRSIFAAHGSPWEPVTDYVYPDDPRIEELWDLDRDLVVLGHTHRAMVWERDGRLIVNPGSVGQPRDHRDQSAYAIIDLDTMYARIERVPLAGP